MLDIYLEQYVREQKILVELDSPSSKNGVERPVSNSQTEQNDIIFESNHDVSETASE